jgi:hypothetical protein
MLPFMAASGHNLYTKSARIYVQPMCKLQVQHPDVYSRFEEGFHVVRRSDHPLTGLAVDVITEQVLMRSMKTSDGLTNNQKFTNMLSAYLQKMNCLTYHASGDADLLIVQKAVDSDSTRNTVLIGDDTDLLILRTYHTNL